MRVHSTGDRPAGNAGTAPLVGSPGLYGCQGQSAGPGYRRLMLGADMHPCVPIGQV